MSSNNAENIVLEQLRVMKMQLDMMEKERSEKTAPKDRVAQNVLGTSQKQMWLSSLLDNNKSRAHNLIASLLFQPGLDIARLEIALSYLLARFPLLTSVPDEDGEVFVEHNFDVTRIIHSCEADSWGSAENIAHSVAADCFDVLAGPLLRLTCVNFEEKTLVVFVCHHIILDGTGVSAFLEELASIYTAGEVAQLPCKEKVDFCDQLIWLQGAEERSGWSAAYQYWDDLGKRLTREAHDRSLLSFGNRLGDRLVINFDHDERRLIKSAARYYKCTPFNYLTTIFAMYLKAVTSFESVLIGVPLAFPAGSASLISRTEVSALLLNLAATRTFKDCLLEVKAQLTEMLDHDVFGVAEAQVLGLVQDGVVPFALATYETINDLNFGGISPEVLMTPFNKYLTHPVSMSVFDQAHSMSVVLDRSLDSPEFNELESFKLLALNGGNLEHKSVKEILELSGSRFDVRVSSEP